MGKLDRTDYLNKSELKKRGWTDVAIERFLPEPERTVSNPYHRTGPRIKHWLRRTAEAVERTEEFLKWSAESMRLKATAAKAVQTKSRRMMDYVNSLTVRLPIIDRETLMAEAIKSAREEAMSRGHDGSPSEERAAVNYLRHECSDYEYELQCIASKCDITEALARLRGKIYAAIAIAYPYLSDECEAQAEQRDAGDDFFEFLFELDSAEEDDS